MSKFNSNRITKYTPCGTKIKRIEYSDILEINKIYTLKEILNENWIANDNYDITIEEPSYSGIEENIFSSSCFVIADKQ